MLFTAIIISPFNLRIKSLLQFLFYFSFKTFNRLIYGLIFATKGASVGFMLKCIKTYVSLVSKCGTSDVPS